MDLACEQGLLNSGWQGIIIANEEGQILAHNQVASQLLDQTNVVGQQLAAILDDSASNQSLVFKTQHYRSVKHHPEPFLPRMTCIMATPPSSTAGSKPIAL